VAGEVALDARDLLPDEEVAGLEAGLDDLREVRERTAAAVVADEGERPLRIVTSAQSARRSVTRSASPGSDFRTSPVTSTDV